MTSGKVPAKAFAVFAVALMLAVVVVPILSSGSDNVVEADTGATTVTYHNPTGSEIVPIVYNGIASAEYNPQYWNDDNGESNWTPPDVTITIKNRITISFDFNSNGSVIEIPQGVTIDYNNQGKVSSSLVWNNPTLSERDDNHMVLHTKDESNGSVWIQYSYTTTTKAVFGGWTTLSDIKIDDGKYVDQSYQNFFFSPGTILSDTVNLYAVWVSPNAYYSEQSIDLRNTSSFTAPAIHYTLPVGKDTNYYGRCTESPSGDNEYTRIYLVNNGDETGDYLKKGTYRSADMGNPSTFYIRETYNGGRDHDYYIPLNGNVIIDNVVLCAGESSTSNHGNDPRHGLFANGHRLIIGTGVTSTGSSPSDYPQVFGGNAGDYEDKDNTTSAEDIDGNIKSTDVVIFSGTYYNVVAGNHFGNIEYDTHLVIRGGTVLDTVVGGNSSSGEGKMDGDDFSNAYNTIRGSTYVYILGGCLPADSHQETALGSRDGSSSIPKGVTLTESTILTGGSNNGKVHGGTNVYISGDAVLWDVQGGGRRGQSTVDGLVSVEVSGQAMIRHVLCGSITDGISEGGAGTPSDLQSYSGSVKDVKIVVKHSAMVASLFGAGYDTYYSPTYASMLGDGTIDIDIIGGTVGYVYGGGYRGAVGYSGSLTGSWSESPIESISITVSGGNVGEVYGGGRGGVDKVLHNAYGGLVQNADQDGFGDSTGFAWTAVDSIAIQVTGGTVGDIYGGGQSVAELTSNGLSGQDRVASVSAGSIEIEVTGGTVNGTIFGGGKGVDPTSNSTDSDTVAFEWDKEKNTFTIGSMAWYEGCGNQYDRTHTDYASVQTGSGDGSGISITTSGATVEIGRASCRERV